MSRLGSTAVQRDRWYEERVACAATPKEQFEVLRSRLMADVRRLPDELHDGVYVSAVEALRGVIESIADAVENPRPIGA